MRLWARTQRVRLDTGYLRIQGEEDLRTKTGCRKEIHRTGRAYYRRKSCQAAKRVTHVT